MELLDALVRADRRINLYEYTLTRLVADHLVEHAGRWPKVRFHRLASVQKDCRLLPRGDCALDRLDRALGRLQALTPLLKAPVVDACAFAVTADNKVQLAQAELLRLICTLLDCPMPPLFDAPA